MIGAADRLRCRDRRRHRLGADAARRSKTAADRGDRMIDFGPGEREHKRRLRTRTESTYRLTYTPIDSWRSQAVRLYTLGEAAVGQEGRGDAGQRGELITANHSPRQSVRLLCYLLAGRCSPAVRRSWRSVSPSGFGRFEEVVDDGRVLFLQFGDCGGPFGGRFDVSSFSVSPRQMAR